MLVMDEKAAAFIVKLRRELDWLRTEYPHQTALIAVAESHLQAVEQAGSVASVTTLTEKFQS